MKDYNEMTLEQLTELIPDHLHLARNSHALPEERFAMYNRITHKYIAVTAHSTAKETLIMALKVLDRCPERVDGSECT